MATKKTEIQRVIGAVVDDLEVVDDLLGIMISALRHGADGLDILEGTKAAMMEGLGMTELQAANMARLMCEALRVRLGLPRAYSDADLETIYAYTQS